MRGRAGPCAARHRAAAEPAGRQHRRRAHRARPAGQRRRRHRPDSGVMTSVSHDTDSAETLDAARHALIRQLTDHPDDFAATIELQAVNAASARLAETVDTTERDSLQACWHVELRSHAARLHRALRAAPELRRRARGDGGPAPRTPGGAQPEVPSSTGNPGRPSDGGRPPGRARARRSGNPASLLRETSGRYGAPRFPAVGVHDPPVDRVALMERRRLRKWPSLADQTTEQAPALATRAEAIPVVAAADAVEVFVDTCERRRS